MTPEQWTTEEEALWRRQHLLSDLREWVLAQPGIEDSGYVTSINDAQAGSTVLVWYGPPDPVQQQIVDEARRRNIPVSVQQRRHSRAELERAATLLTTIASGTGVFHNFQVSAIADLDIDFDGVTVIGEHLRPPAEGIADADAALAQALTAATGVAVTIEHGRFELL
ncbi:hypothetical protein KOI35_32000 [Actinoplanes bogorensis]|uniref:Uncharacterized protein n=1 Tax=Paractinoplanes bogorensis TaxID=1610840 RepID=A0ABS5YXH9_9ACTN|nr:hypothetical protein [Actinoplanes bogorensis]MBU2668144.1 hypothetical protein [Actinoplanes bogorensis]